MLQLFINSQFIYIIIIITVIIGTEYGVFIWRPPNLNELTPY